MAAQRIIYEPKPGMPLYVDRALYGRIVRELLRSGPGAKESA